MNVSRKYTYSASIKSELSDELINTYLIRPLAGLVVRFLFHTPITPNVVTGTAIVTGLLSAAIYTNGSATHVVIAGLLITLKDILDSADGQLARAREQYSRAGRFLDSIGDVVVNFMVLGGITFTLFRQTDSFSTIFLGFVAFMSMTLRVSYHVFYQTAYLRLEGMYEKNRLTEEILEEDKRVGAWTLRLQYIYQFVYGWQDRLMKRIDQWCRGAVETTDDRLWYGDRLGLKISGMIGLGTELFVLTLFSLLNRLEAYLIVNVCLMNTVWLSSVLYRRGILRRRL